ncbi:MAG: prepilin-type N-terminal cleavage/methylation domain-containing protein [Phycisphaerales bacterium]|nr:prepilin-type N-terminal cleavage/methylation domain-containing protein [Phycisphaerales bacterium]
MNRFVTMRNSGRRQRDDDSGRLVVQPGSKQPGFTLIELMVVVGIIALLMGILLPSLNKARRSAQLLQCQSNLRQIVTGIFAYANDHNGFMPVAAPQELGGPQGIVPASDPWLVPRMFGGSMPAEKRPLNSYLASLEVFRSPCDRGEPLWWFDTAPYQATSTCYELYGTSYFYASGYNAMGGVAAPMGIAKYVGLDFAYHDFQTNWLKLGQALKLTRYPDPSRKVVIGSIPIHRTMSGVVASSARAQWYKDDPDHLYANAAFADGHVEFVQVFAYDSGYNSVDTQPDAANPYY